VETLEHPPPERSTASALKALERGPGRDWGGLATSVLAALLVVYLALENGGYEPIPRDQVGVAVWWLLVLAVGVEALPVPGRTRAALVTLGLLAGFAAWTGLSFIWTDSAERTANELARVVTYLGIFALGISLVTRRLESARDLLTGVTLGLAAIAVLGVLSRLHMAWFPANELGTVLPGIEIERRLAYPLNYSSGMGALMGMTMPLLLAATASTRRIAFQALAAAAIPIAGLALFLTASGTGVAVATVAMAAFLLLAPDRLPKLATLAAGAAGTALLAGLVHQRDALSRGLPTPAAESQGTEVLLIAIVVCLAVGTFQVGVSLAVSRWERPAWLQINRTQALWGIAASAVIAILLALSLGLPQEASDRWEAFKGREGSSTSSSTSLIDSSGSGRYQFWQSAVDAGETEPLTGIGPGTFEFWWARHGSYSGFIRDAHSLYLENFAELGIVGLLLIAGFVFTVLGLGTVRSLRAPPESRLILAAATAGIAGFAMAAALDWVWELAAIAAVFMLLSAVAVSGFSLKRPSTRRRRRTKQLRRNRQQRIGVALAAIVALLVIWFPLSGATALRESEVDAARGDLDAALDHARDATDSQPYAASPRIQEALILEQQRRLLAAEAAATEAKDREGVNWRTWLILGRIQAERGRVGEAIRSYRQARVRNPKSELLR
jgi:O-antigen ligase/polysaccharide polymerase Wzy-like membrane protein